MPIPFIHRLHIHATFRKELTELYLFMLIRSFAVSLIILFEPVYLYIVFDESISAVLLFFAAIVFLFALGAPFGASLVARVGEKHAMLMAVPLLVGYYLLLQNLHVDILLIPAAILMRGLHEILFWPAFHFDFLRSSDHEWRGREFSFLLSLVSIAAATGPILGGIILSVSWLGFPVLFSVVMGLLALAFVVLFRTPDVRDDYRAPYKESWTMIFSKTFWRSSAAFAASGGETAVSMFLWPIFLFSLAFSFSTMGALGTVASLIGISVMLFVGALADRTDRKRLISLGTRADATIWILKMFAQAQPHLFVLHTLHGFAKSLVAIPFMSIYFDRASEEAWHRQGFIILREITLNLGRAFVLVVLAAVFLFTDNIAVAFFFAAVLTLFRNLI